jgi:type II secretory ATPase GspE/PulE/Tfp pilus assembly ATPase PilB-like protein
MKLTRSDVSPSEIKKAALSEGMRELYDNAVQKMLSGITTKEEVLRVVKV